MSKHTQKVHGKLNFLMVAVVAVIGAVSYLLIQSGTIDPSSGTSSGIKGVQKADKYVSKNDVCLLYTSPSPRDLSTSRMPSSA